MKIIDSERKITINDIIEFEIKYNIQFPSNYKKLILKYNGGIEESGNEIIDQLYSLKYGKTTLNIVRELMQVVEHNIPKEYLVFATDGTGNQIAINIDIESTNQSKIYLFRYDELEPILLANSLEELLGVDSIDDL